MTFDELQFSRLELKPGEAIVLRCDHAISHGLRKDLTAYVQSKLGASVPVLVLDAGMDISTVKVALNPGAAWPFPDPEAWEGTKRQAAETSEKYAMDDKPRRTNT